jgi:hypothetical protein
MNTSLVDFLLARIAEDEAKIQHMTREAERVATAPIFRNYPPDWLLGVDIFVSPDRWRAECAAKRHVLNLHPEAVSDEKRAGAAWAYDEVLRLLALPYSSHPDYRDEWRP